MNPVWQSKGCWLQEYKNKVNTGTKVTHWQRIKKNVAQEEEKTNINKIQ